METTERQLRVAVVGAGIAGISAAYLLSKRHDVTLIERDESIGGHTNTVEVRHDGRVVPVDTGFIVCNPRTYPLFYRLLGEWGVRLRDSDMSFGYSCETSGVAYVGPSLSEFAARPSNLLSPRLIRMIIEQRRFNRLAARDLREGRLGTLTLGEYLDAVDAAPFFVEHYLIPLAAAVWSSPDTGMLDFPAETFIRFFDNHGMLDLRTRPTWQTVVGGSHAYLRAFRRRFTGRVLSNAPVTGVKRTTHGVLVGIEGHGAEPFDRVVMATHADVTLALLDDATGAERRALSAWQYHTNPVQLHSDASVMPRDRRLWASWNYHRRANSEPRSPVPVTYYMNRLQGLDRDRDYLVSLNARHVVDPATVIYEVEYTHPGYTSRSFDAQRELRAMNGAHNTYFCGAYMRHGFHEDAVHSSVEAARHFGVTP
jgi:predicted NAD/FAD-binding protein